MATLLPLKRLEGLDVAACHSADRTSDVVIDVIWKVRGRDARAPVGRMESSFISGSQRDIENLSGNTHIVADGTTLKRERKGCNLS